MSRIDETGRSLELSCHGCGAVNRVPLRRLAQGPVCGRCRQPLGVEHPIEVSDRTFGSLIAESALPVLVDFWAPWCGPCRALAPELEQVARQAGRKLLVAKLNSDDNPATSAAYGIRSIPSMVLFEDGREKQRLMGAMPAREILARIG